MKTIIKLPDCDLFISSFAPYYDDYFFSLEAHDQSSSSAVVRISKEQCSNIARFLKSKNSFQTTETEGEISEWEISLEKSGDGGVLISITISRFLKVPYHPPMGNPPGIESANMSAENVAELVEALESFDR